VAEITETPAANARVYYPMFDGLAIDGQLITDLRLWLKIGGHQAANDTNYQISVYGREHINGPNLVTLYRRLVTRPAGTAWLKKKIARKGIDKDPVRCIVVKLEEIEPSWSYTPVAHTATYDDQVGTADDPSWGVRITKAIVNGTDLHRRVTLERVMGDVLSHDGFSASGVPDLEIDQLTFTEAPCSRLDALRDLNEMIGYDYFCWSSSTVTFQSPTAGAVRHCSVSEPGVSLSIVETIAESYNAVRVGYTNKRGRPREVIVHAGSAALGGDTKADYLVAPESIRSAEGARRLGKRYLRDRKKTGVSGSLTLTGAGSWGDALTCRPGERWGIGGVPGIPSRLKATRVTLRPLSWQADVQFDLTPWRFDAWLARLAAKAHVRKR